jgi:hypothetical protein
VSGLLITVSEFRNRVSDLDELVRELRDLTGRGGPEEAEAWRRSLPAAAKAFSAPYFDNLHLYFGGRGRLTLEYRLPSAPYWCDIVLLGAHEKRPSSVIVELKDWHTRTDRPGPIEGLMYRQGREELHPSDQVKGYTEYCRKFHSAVAEHGASVHGCVLFTRDFFCQSYSSSPNDRLARDYPLFTLSPEDLAHRFPTFFSDKLSEPDDRFAENFARGFYRQDRSFIRSVAEQLADPKSSPLELLDGQRRALSLCRHNIESSIFDARGPQKAVIVVEGPPGSGKSVVAARLWANLVCDERLPEGNVTFVTTSVAQASNWRSIFDDAANDVAARGIVLTANDYMPFTTQDVGRVRRADANVLTDILQWRENYSLMCQLCPDRHRSPDGHYLVSIIDEAHALINPEHSDARGQFGFAVHIGPQAYHLIRSSMVSVFFLDPRQSFRERESTAIDDLRKWASEFGANFVGPVSLAGAQFRCGGSEEFVGWVDAVCKHEPEDRPSMREAPMVYAAPLPPAFEFSTFDSPFDLEKALRGRRDEGRTVRFLSSYAREWKTGKAENPHGLPDQLKDFHEAVRVEGVIRTWSKIWNHIPGGTDYTAFVRASQGTHMHTDPLSEVGCPYVVRGFDFDYIGLLWLNDLKWRSGKWIVELDNVFESGLARHVGRAAHEGDSGGPEHVKLIEKLLQGYRILLTRAMRGVYVWFEDGETREYLSGSYTKLFGGEQMGEGRP